MEALFLTRKPKPETTPGAEAAPLGPATGQPLRCAACQRVITDASARIEISGRHVHAFMNPSAFVYIFGCFSQAPGAVIRGAPTAEATWFAGCRWQFEHCGGCQAHLGWYFTGASSFHALILDRLVQSP